MKIFICCSKHHYNSVPDLKESLEKEGHIITLPNSFDDPFSEEKIKQQSKEEHIKFKEEMLALQERKIKDNDAILVLNLEKNGQENYVGGATFLEIFKAWELKKKIYLYNNIPNSMLTDEIEGFNPIILNQDLTKIK